MTLRLEAEVLSLHTRHPFIIARGGQSDYDTVWVKLVDHDGMEGWGEAAPTRFYGETTETVLAALQAYATVMPKDPFDHEGAELGWATKLKRNPSARAALSAALHDLAGKRLGVPVYRLWGLDPAKAPQSTFTIGIDTAEKIRAKVLEAGQYPILKIKLGSDRDLEILQTIRDATDREIRVDANCGWTVKQAIRMLPVLREFGVTVLEQPLPPDQLDGLGQIRRHADIPLIADESCETRCRHSPAGRQGGRDQHQAGQVRQSPGGAPDDRRGPGPRDDGHGRLHDRKLTRHHRGRPLHPAGGHRGPGRRRAAGQRSLPRAPRIDGGPAPPAEGPGLGVTRR